MVAPDGMAWRGNTSSGTGAVRESLVRAWLGSVNPYSPSRAILRVLGWAPTAPTAPRGVSAPNPALLGAFLGEQSSRAWGPPGLCGINQGTDEHSEVLRRLGAHPSRDRPCFLAGTSKMLSGWRESLKKWRVLF